MRTTTRTSGRWLTLLAMVVALGLSSPGPTAGPVSYTEVLNHSVHTTVQLPGTVEARTASVVAAEVAGLVVKREVRAGDRVREGKPLVRLRTNFLELRLRAAQGRLREAEARLDQAERNLARARELFEEKIVSQEELDDGFSEFTAWQARVDQSTAEIGQIELALDRSVVRAPFTGVVVKERTDVGQWVEQGGPVAEMVFLDELQVRVELPERYYDLLYLGTEVQVRFDALSDLEVRGTVDRIIPRADPQARTFPVTVVVPNPDGRIGVGMLTRVGLPIGRSSTALLIPKDAVVRQGTREFVYRITSDSSIEVVDVESEQGIGDWIVIQGALDAGQRVVTRGNERLRPGQTVEGELLEYPLP